MNKRNTIILLVLLLSIGFAAVTTTLVINGTTLFGIKDDDFQVIFTKAIVDDIDMSDTVINDDGSIITYETKELATVGDESVLEFSVSNTSTQYDAEININCIGGANKDNYYEIIYDLPTFLEARSVVDGYVTVKMLKNSTEEIIEELTCTLNVSAIERDVAVTGDIIENNSYSLYGTLIDVDGNPIINATVVAYSEPQYATTELDGYLWIGGLERGSHRVYLLKDINLENAKTLSEDEIVQIAVSKMDITTESDSFVFDDGTILQHGVIEPTTSIEVTFKANSGDLSFDTKQYIKGKREVYGDLPEVKSNLYNSIKWYVNNDDEQLITDESKVMLLTNFEVYANYSFCSDLMDICWVDRDGSESKTLGDIISIGEASGTSENFYILSFNHLEIQMLSKYNLNVGGYYDGESWQAYDTVTGIQDKEMIGYTSDVPYKGTIAYGSSTSYDSSVVKQYVDTYADYIANLLNMSASEITTGIISKDDLDGLAGYELGAGANLSAISSIPAWIYSSTYWTNTAYNTTSLWRVNSFGDFSYHSFSDPIYRGVRPKFTIDVELLFPEEICNDNNVCWVDVDYDEEYSFGDIISIGTQNTSIEKFYVLSNKNDEVRMLSMHNLYVGGQGYESGTVTAYENPTGLQDESMKGWGTWGNPYEGVVPFGSSNDYNTSTIKVYVDTYGEYIANQLGLSSSQYEASLINKDDITELTGKEITASTNLNTFESVPAWIYTRTYWTSIPGQTNYTWLINSASKHYSSPSNTKIYRGVRPVITVNSDLL